MNEMIDKKKAKDDKDKASIYLVPHLQNKIQASFDVNKILSIDFIRFILFNCFENTHSFFTPWLFQVAFYYFLVQKGSVWTPSQLHLMLGIPRTAIKALDLPWPNLQFKKRGSECLVTDLEEVLDSKLEEYIS
jgi:hypothetical protein